MAKATSKYDTLLWIEKLRAAGFIKFKKEDLPRELQINKYLFKAIREGYIVVDEIESKKGSLREQQTKVWRIDDSRIARTGRNVKLS